MGWNNNHEFLSAPISLEDISYAAGIVAPPYNLGQMIETSNTINKWARYKPFSSNTIAFAFDDTKSTPSLRQPDREAPLKAKNFGLATRIYTTSDLAWQAGVALNELGSDWLYVKPHASNGDYFRVLDFDGYNRLAQAPFQYMPDPNPAFLNDTVRIQDIGGAVEIEKSELTGDGTVVDSNYAYRNLSGCNIYTFLGKRPTASTHASAPSLVYALNSIVSGLSVGTWDCVTVLTNLTLTEGSYVSTVAATGKYFVLAPIGLQTFRYSDGFGFKDAGVAVGDTFEIDVYRSISYTTLGIQFKTNDSWGTTQVLETTSGTIYTDTGYSNNNVLVTGDAYRMVVNGTADTEIFYPASSPI